MFHTASTLIRPLRPPRLTLWLTVAPGCFPPSLNSAILLPPTKYCQVLVAWRAVSTQLKGTLLPTDVAGQPLPSLSSTAKRLLPPLHEVSPFGPSTLCGSCPVGPPALPPPPAPVSW